VFFCPAIHVLPFDDSVQGISGNLFETYLKPYFQVRTHDDHNELRSRWALSEPSRSIDPGGRHSIRVLCEHWRTSYARGYEHVLTSAG